MKKLFRIIPWLEVKNSNLVKGINMEGLRSLGDPINFAKLYYEEGADELVFYDVVASLYGQNKLLNLISKVSQNTFIPLTVSGGIKSINDIKKVLRAGADRICINSKSFNNINFVGEAANIFGSSTIVANIQTLKIKDKYYCFYYNGREKTGVELNYWIKSLIDKGAGEIIISSIENEGTLKGINLDLIKYLKIPEKIPLIIHGGCSGKEHLINKKIKNISSVDGFAISSLFHYYYIQNQGVQKKNNIGNYEFINNVDSIYRTVTQKFMSIKKYKSILKKKFNTRLN